MYHIFFRTAGIILGTGLALALVGCGGGTRVLKDAEPLTLVGSLASSADQQLEVTLDWVIVRDGPGTWARNADWDEYLLRIRNRSDESVRVTGIAIYDSLSFRQETTNSRKRLVDASRATTKRYDAEGLTVKAGIGGGTLMAAGVAAGTFGVAAGVTALTTASYGTAAGAAGAATAGLLAAPVLIVGGFVRAAKARGVEREIVARQTDLPVDMPAGAERAFDAFFPLAPSPGMIEVNYVGSSGPRQLILDTSVVLQGLHTVDKATGAESSYKSNATRDEI